MVQLFYIFVRHTEKHRNVMKAKTTAKLLALLGFSTAANSCEALSEIGGGGGLVMYGSPSASYEFNIEVKDVNDGKPIEGIRVSLLERGYYHNSATQEREEVIDTLAKGLTNAQGKVVLKHGGHPIFYDKAEFAAEDVDGSENGEYNSNNVEIKIERNEFVDNDDNSWSLGKVTKDITLKLTKK